MSLPALIAVLLGVSLTAYALFAGADFGAGILDLLAGSRDPERKAIAATIGPVWEANHVWLIFSITILFSAFPAAFSALGTALLAPLTIALLAIVLRSAALGLRASPGTPARARAMLSRQFGAASLLAPFMFGAVAGALAAVSSSPRLGAPPVPDIPWTGAFALVIGALAAALCAQLAANFVALGMVRSGEPRLAEHFRVRGLQSGACVLVLALAALPVAAASAPAVWHRLIGEALPLVLIGLGAGAMSVLATWRRRYLLARGACLTTGAAVLWGWFVSQAPHLIGARLTIHAAAATHAALVSIRDRRRRRPAPRTPRYVPALLRVRPARAGGNRMKRLALPHIPDRRPLAAGAVTLWIAISPWLWGFADSHPAVANHVSVVFAFGPLALLIANLRPAAFVTLLGGIWLAISPWLLGYATDHAAWLGELITGLLLIVLCASAAGFPVYLRGRARLARKGSAAQATAKTAGSSG